MFALIDSNSANIETDIDEEMKQTIDRLYKTAIFHIVNDTDYAVLSKKKKVLKSMGEKQIQTKELLPKRNKRIYFRRNK